MQRVYNVQFHSMVDLITNSSSVVYIAANANATDRIHELVDALLTLGGSELESRDLFDIYIAPDFDTVWDYAQEVRSEESDDFDSPNLAAIREYLQDDEGFEGDILELLVGLAATDYQSRTAMRDEFYAVLSRNPDASEGLVSVVTRYDGYPVSQIQVIAKGTGENEQLAARILSNLDGLFNYEATYG